MSSKIMINEVSVALEDLEVLSDVSFSLDLNEIVCVLGPSGCGKTTLLNTLAGIVKVTNGDIQFPNSVRNIGYVYQEPRLIPWRNVLKNVAFALENSDEGQDEIDLIAKSKLALTGLSDFAEFPVHKLSGGMKQKVALARALCLEPQLLLLDEPFGSLDWQSRLTIQSSLLPIWESLNATVVVVTHDPFEAVMIADKLILLSNRPATVLSVYSLDLPKPRLWSDPQVFEVFKEVLDRLDLPISDKLMNLRGAEHYV